MASCIVTQADGTVVLCADPVEAAIAAEITRGLIAEKVPADRADARADAVGRCVRRAIQAYRGEEAGPAKPSGYDCSGGRHLLSMMPNEHDGWVRHRCIGCGTIQYAQNVRFGIPPE